MKRLVRTRCVPVARISPASGKQGRLQCRPRPSTAADSRQPTQLRIDVVEQIEQTTWGELKARLHATKRNYFTQGLAAREMLARIDADPQLRPLLASLDRAKFDRALEHRARHLASDPARIGAQCIWLCDGAAAASGAPTVTLTSSWVCTPLASSKRSVSGTAVPLGIACFRSISMTW